MKVKDISFDDLFRYAYGGILLALLAAWIDSEHTGKTVKALGNVIAPLAVLGLGGAVYVFYRVFIGEWIIFPLLIWVHGWGCVGSSSCKYRYLCENIPLTGKERTQLWWISARRAFQLLRDKGQAFDAVNRTRFRREHSELHLVYLTMFVCMIAVVWSALERSWYHAAAFTLAGILFLIAGIASEVSLNRRECDQLKNHADAKWLDTAKSLCQRAGIA